MKIDSDVQREGMQSELVFHLSQVLNKMTSSQLYRHTLVQYIYRVSP